MATISPVNSQFLIKPRILENESIRGYIARVRYYGASDGMTATRNYLGKHSQRLAWVYPSQLGKLCELFHPALPSTPELINGHTLFPLFRPFLPEKSVSNLYEHFSGKGRQQVASLVGWKHSGLTNRWDLSICLECVKQDQASTLSTPYWRTGHTVPALALCPYHLSPLYVYCQTCQSGFRTTSSVFLPTAKCLCGGKLCLKKEIAGVVHQRSEESIAHAVQQALANNLPPSICYDNVLEAIARQAHDVGYGQVRNSLKKVGALLERTIGSETLSAYDLKINSCTNFHKTLQGKALSRNPLHSLILINFFFGLLPQFAQSLQGGTSPEQIGKIQMKYVFGNEEGFPKPVRKRLPPSQHWDKCTQEEIARYRKEYCAVIRAAIKAKPHLKRSELGLWPLRKAYTFLLKFDKPWLDKTVPRKACKEDDPKKAIEKRASLDRSISEHIRSRHTLLRQANFDKQITHRRLVHGHTLESCSKKRFSSLPLTTTALAEFVETPRQWHQRKYQLCAKQALALSETSYFCPKRSLDNLSLCESKALIRRVQKWMKRQRTK